MAYLFAVTFTRFSVLTYYLRIFPPGLTSLRRCCHVLITLALLLFLEIFIVLVVYCKDIGQLWTDDWLDFTGSQCFSSSTYSYSASVGDSIIDSMIFTLPIPYVWRLSQIHVRQRSGLIVIFGLGFFVCVVALLQIPFIRKREGIKTYFGSTVNILIAIQISFAIIAASLPDLRALVARSFPNFSPLHHRSLVAGNCDRVEACDQERIFLEEEVLEESRRAFEGKRVFRKPDWMRNSIPSSLLSTTITQNEVTQISRIGSLQHVQHVLQVPDVAVKS
jgi:hypothetical protein